MLEEKLKEISGQLREVEEKYRILFENSGDMIFTLDKNGIITSFNRGAEKNTGYATQEVIGKFFVDVLAMEGTKQLEMRRFRKRLDTQESRPYETMMRTRDGERRFVLINSLRLEDNQGEVTGLACILKDVTGRKRAEQETKRVQYLLDKVVDSIADAIVITDKKGLISFYNEGAVEIFGHHPSDILGKPVLDFYVRKKDAQKVKQMLLKSKEGKISNFETQFLTRDGRTIFVNMSATLIRNEGGEIVGTLGINRDITERKRYEEALKEKLEELEKWYKLTVDRELKMIELKNEIRALANELNELKQMANPEGEPKT